MYGQRSTNNQVVIEDQQSYAIGTTNTILSFFLFLIAIGIFGFGVWLAVWTSYFNYAAVIMYNDLYRAGYILLIISGSLLMVVAFIGLCGSTQRSSCLLLTFITVLIICEIMLIAIAGVSMAFNQNFINYFEANLTDSIQRTYGVSTEITRNSEVTTAIDQMQQQLSCCGASGNGYTGKSWSLYKSSTWILGQNYGPPYVPLSCCALQSNQVINAAFCQGATQIGSPPAPPIANSSTVNNYLNMQGCYTVLSDALTYYSRAMFGLSLASAIYLLIILILSCVLVRDIEVKKKELNDLQSGNLEKDMKHKVQPTKDLHSIPKQRNTNEYQQNESPIKNSYKDSQRILK